MKVLQIVMRVARIIFDTYVCCVCSQVCGSYLGTLEAVSRGAYFHAGAGSTLQI